MGKGEGGKIVLHVKKQHMERELETTKENDKKFHKELTITTVWKERKNGHMELQNIGIS